MNPYDDFEILGMLFAADYSEIRPKRGEPIDPEFAVRIARAHEEGGFDRALLGYGSMTPETTQFAAHVAANTERLGLLIAHRPGVVHPTLASRLFATLDHFSKGRVALNIVSGGNQVELQREGDYLEHDARYARTDEYLQILRACWDTPGPHSFDGSYYRFEGFTPVARPYQDRHLELFFGGSSPAAYSVGAKHADTYMLWGEPLKQTGDQISAVTEQTEHVGRDRRPRMSVSFRPIVAKTDDEAWERAHRILDIMVADRATTVGASQLVAADTKLENIGSQRLLEVAAEGEVHDRCLWTPSNPAISYSGNHTALVGSYETVAAAILDYAEIGVNGVLIRGYEPLEDAIDYGENLLPLIREELAHRKATRSTPVS